MMRTAPGGDGLSGIPPTSLIIPDISVTDSLKGKSLDQNDHDCREVQS